MKPEETVFHEITLQDKAWMDRKFAEDDRNACEYSFANNFMWRNVYQVRVAELHGCLVVRFIDGEIHCFSFPVGNGDKKAAVEELLAICHEEEIQLLIAPASEQDRAQMLEWFPGRFLIEGDRNDYDYIYTREKLATLAGKKLHGKRNHIARFKDSGDWSYEPMTAENVEECRTMTYTWIHMREEKWNEEMNQEISVLHEAFDHMQELGLVGGVLRRDGQIVAFSIGERLNSETFVVHFEKAYPDLQGAYPMINQQFVLHECEGYAYVNREEDTGDPGLRKAKLSYYPDILLPKYELEESGVVYADPERDAPYIQEMAEMFWRRGRLYSVLSEAPHDEREHACDFPRWKTGIDGKFPAGAVPVQRGVCGRALCVCGCDTAGIPGTEACGTDSAFCGRKISGAAHSVTSGGVADPLL